MGASSGTDNILAGILGALSGVQSGLQPYAQAEYQNRLQQGQLQNQLGYEKQLLPIQSNADFDLFQRKLPLETQSKIDIAKATPNYIVGPDGTIKATLGGGKVTHLPYAPGSGSKVDTRTIGQIRANNEPLPPELQNDTNYDSMRLTEYNTRRSADLNDANRQTSNQVSAGKTSIFQGIRNSNFGIPGFGSQSQNTGSGVTPGGRKFKVIQ